LRGVSIKTPATEARTKLGPAFMRGSYGRWP
jgi:hypothetical protein